jgi:hypothetical protein
MRLAALNPEVHAAEDRLAFDAGVEFSNFKRVGHWFIL